MSVEMEGLEFQIEASADEASKGIDALANSFKRLKSALGGKNLDKVSSQMEKLSNALNGFGNSTEKISTLGQALQSLTNVRISPSTANQITKIGNAVSSIRDEDIDRVERLSDALQQVSNAGSINVPNLSNVTSAANTTITPTAPDTSGFSEAAVTMTEFSDAEEQAAGETEQLNQRMEESSEEAEESSTRFEKLKEVLSGIGNGFRSFGNDLKTKFIDGIRKITSGFTSLLNSIKRIAMYRMIRWFFSALSSAMKEGINNLYQYSKAFSGTFANSLDSVATSFQYLKNSMAAMVSPLVNALAPAIEYVTDKVVALFNVINQLLARLTGSSTYTAAVKVATEYAEAADTAADSTGDVADAAEELKKTILGFDEINALNDNSTSSIGSGSGTGGSGDGTDYGSMFQELPISDYISDFADQLLEAFENGDWETLGVLIGDKINEAIDSVNWSGIGSTIGYGINGAVQTAYYILDTIDFQNIGTHLAELLNAALEQIDFEFVGRLFVKQFTMLPDIIIGVINTLDFGLVGRSISDFITGAIDEAAEWIDSVDWAELSDSLYQGFKDLVTNIEWLSIATSLITLFGSAVSAVFTSIGTIVGDIGADIKAWWDESIAGQDWEDCAGDLMQGLFTGIINIVNGIGTWVYENVVEPFVSAFKEHFGINSPSTVMMELGGYVIEGFLLGIVNFFGDIGTWVNENIVQPIQNALSGIDLGVAAETVTTTVSVAVKKAGTWVSDAWTALQSAGSTFTTTVQAAVKKAGTWVSDAWNAATMITGTVTKTVLGAVKKASTWVADAWTAVKMTTGTVTKTVQGAVKKSSTWVAGAWTVVQMKTSTITKTAKAVVKKGSTWVADAFTALKAVSGTVTKKITVTVKGVTSKLLALLGLSSGGVVTSMGVRAFADGGIVGTDKWYKSIPKYASGTGKAHGTMFVAGEAGPEIVGHVGGQTEVLNKSQLASTMYSSVSDAFGRYTGYWDAINQTIALCASAVIDSMPDISGYVILSSSANADTSCWPVVTEYTMPEIDSEELSEDIREAILEANAKQNELLKQQNEWLEQLYEKDTSTEITTNSFTKAINQRNRRDGKTVIPVGT